MDIMNNNFDNVLILEDKAEKAAKIGDIETVKNAFLRNARNHNIVAYIAAENNYVDIVKLSLKYISNVFVKNLIAKHAVKAGRTNITKLLIKNGANQLDKLLKVAKDYNRHKIAFMIQRYIDEGKIIIPKINSEAPKAENIISCY